MRGLGTGPILLYGGCVNRITSLADFLYFVQFMDQGFEIRINRCDQFNFMIYLDGGASIWGDDTSGQPDALLEKVKLHIELKRPDIKIVEFTNNGGRWLNLNSSETSELLNAWMANLPVANPEQAKRCLNFTLRLSEHHLRNANEDEATMREIESEAAWEWDQDSVDLHNACESNINNKNALN